MGEDNNEVAREVVISVLRRYVSVTPTGTDNWYTIDGVPADKPADAGAQRVIKSVQLHEYVRKRVLFYLERMWGVHVHLFYNPTHTYVRPSSSDKVM